MLMNPKANNGLLEDVLQARSVRLSLVGRDVC